MTSIDETTMGELREIAARYPQARSGLLPMLHLVQSVDGHLSDAGIEACAEVLELTPAEVRGVATFYSMYHRSPVGEHLVGVCTNTLCAVMGGDAIYARLRERVAVDDPTITLEHVECNAACDYAPVVMVNWEFLDNQTPASAEAVIDDLRAGRPVRSTRGPQIGTFRQAERVLAGFEDGRADEGPAAGPASLVGLGIARAAGFEPPARSASGAGGGAPAGQSTATLAEDKLGAVRQADTQRAESETIAEESR